VTAQRLPKRFVDPRIDTMWDDVSYTNIKLRFLENVCVLSYEIYGLLPF